MAIFYAIIAKRNNIVLAEYAEYTGNFQQYAMQLMLKIEADTLKTFELDEVQFHYVNEDGLSVICMTEKTTPKKIAFAFLQDLRNTFVQQYSAYEIETARAY